MELIGYQYLYSNLVNLISSSIEYCQHSTNVDESDMSSQAGVFGWTVTAPEDLSSNTEDAEIFSC